MEFLGFHLRNNLFVAPMAGVTDRPFRQLCKKLGAGLAVSEMVTSNSLLYGSAKTRRRANHDGEVDPVSVQIAGADPAMMAQAASYNADHGAQIIDINMGCPAKKVCNVMAGSALMQNEPLVAKILEAVVAAVPDAGDAQVPHRLEPREPQCADIARIAEESGIRAIAIHGRTRADQYRAAPNTTPSPWSSRGSKIPVIANGDITAAKGTLRPRLHRRRRRHDRPRGAGASLAVPRDRAFPGHRRRNGRRRARKKSTPSCAITWPNSTASTARRPACASRASTSAGTPRAWSGAAHFRHAMNQLQTVREQLAAADEFFLGHVAANERLRP
jgi:tRNA-dihydrouridine synthase B